MITVTRGDGDRSDRNNETKPIPHPVAVTHPWLAASYKIAVATTLAKDGKHVQARVVKRIDHVRS